MQNKLFKCDYCGLEYSDAALAAKCRDWCSKYKTCNLEIIKYAIKKKGGENNNE